MKKKRNFLQAIYRPNFEFWLREQGMSVRHFLVDRHTGGQFMVSHMSGAKRSSQVFIVLHSTGCDRFMPLVGLYRHLLQSGLDVIAIDLDGHGRDSSTYFDSRKIQSERHILQDLLTSHSELQNYQRVHLLGQSLGACMIVDFLSRGPNTANVGKAVLVGMPVKLDLRQISVLKESFDFISPTLWRSLFSYGIPGVIPVPGAMRRRLFPIRTHDQRGYLTEIVGYINDLNIGSRISGLKTPLLNIYGGLDSIAQEIASVNKHDYVTPFHLPLATHYSILYSEAYFAKVIQFIQD